MALPRVVLLPVPFAVRNPDYSDIGSKISSVGFRVARSSPRQAGRLADVFPVRHGGCRSRRSGPTENRRVVRFYSATFQILRRLKVVTQEFDNLNTHFCPMAHYSLLCFRQKE